jgi:thiol:disulfide interchange protein DsbD
MVLERNAMAAFFRERDVALFRADWTNSDPVITAALERQGRIGVPVYLVYRPGEEARVLPQILTESIVRDAFERPDPTKTETR